MNVESHDLIHEFPEYKTKIHDLKMNNNHFHNLFEKYDENTTKIEGLEKEDIPITDKHMEDLKKERLAIKDEIYKMLLDVE